MEFRNERTWQNAVELGKTEEFHVNYETAVDKVRSEFGQTLPMIIDGKEVRTTATFLDVSPADIRVVLGLLQHGTKAHAKRAIKAARAAFPTWSATPWAARVRIVQRAADLTSARKFRYASLLALEYEKNRSEAMAGLPPGVFNFVTGAGATVGQELVDNPEVDGFVFTGSRAVGLQAFRAFTQNRPKPIITEMGGKNPTIVTRSADVEKAALGVMRAAFGYGGQKCSACSRVLVDRSVSEAFLERLVAETQKIKVGDPTHRDGYLGPLINDAAVSTYEKAVADIRKSKGKILLGGQAGPKIGQ